MSAELEHYYLRSDRWYYIWYRDRDVDELYDIERDAERTENVASAHPEVVRRLRSRVRLWKRDLLAHGPAPDAVVEAD